MTKKKLRIAIAPITPFVFKDKGNYTGFEIELWEMIAKKIGRDFSYEKYGFQDLIPVITQKKADLAFGAITVKEEREKVIDFSFSTFDSGLRIMVTKNRSRINFIDTAKNFLTHGYQSILKPLAVLILIVFLFGNILWLAEEGTGAFSTDYTGVGQATWLSLSIAMGSPTILTIYAPKSWLGVIILQIVQLFKLVVLGLIIGQLAAFFTARKIIRHIKGPQDLNGKIVATLKNATSEKTLRTFGAKVVTVNQIEQAYEKLKKGQVEAVVFDAPILDYYAKNQGVKWVKVVGETFDQQKYGLIIQTKSKLREEINRAILTLRESGQYEELRNKWFGKITV
ncbi:MAG: transporter substrate-binding domain-containing protein [Candidatus Vogelbacteria bacterium]|nr:transporter substrate-binding domain-containing protein [Candidatus Vogelbacteria bacterium]